MPVVIKRVYEKPSARDGCRVLVDRLWPRGLSKQSAKVNLWLKDIAPSNELRQWFHERRSQWMAFREKYVEELAEPERMAALEQLQAVVRARKAVTLLFASTDVEHNNAVVLKELLDGMKKPPRSTGAGAAAAVRISKRQSR